MNRPAPRRTAPTSPVSAEDQQLRRWLVLRRDLAELHARLEYLKLMVRLGVLR